MRRKHVLTTVLVGAFVLGAVALAFAGPWPDAVMQQVNGFHDAEQAKHDMPPAVEGLPTINGQDAYKLWQSKKAIFLDVRIKTQYETEKIAGAIWFFNDDFMKDSSMADKLDKEKEYVVYCNGVRCWRSPATAVMLHNLGFKKVYWYRDGVPDWKKQGYPTE
ncbi:MAG: rhodanese-like domain-containing protein [Thermodesulfovibrionales bacterium]|jgi:rhodanese-related sulfurtransferase